MMTTMDLSDDESSLEALGNVICHGDAWKVRALIQDDPRVEALLNVTPGYALDTAITCQQYHLVPVLLELGAVPTTRTLDLAIGSGILAPVRALLDYDYQRERREVEGGWLGPGLLATLEQLQRAVASKKADLVRLLLEKGQLESTDELIQHAINLQLGDILAALYRYGGLAASSNDLTLALSQARPAIVQIVLNQKPQLQPRHLIQALNRAGGMRLGPTERKAEQAIVDQLLRVPLKDVEDHMRALEYAVSSGVPRFLRVLLRRYQYPIRILQDIVTRSKYSEHTAPMLIEISRYGPMLSNVDTEQLAKAYQRSVAWAGWLLFFFHRLPWVERGVQGALQRAVGANLTGYLARAI